MSALTDILNAQQAEFSKIHDEVSGLVAGNEVVKASLAELQAVLENRALTPEEQAALDAHSAALADLDALIPDKAPEPVV